VVLAIANTGPVIAPQEVGSLFEPFQRLGADRTGRDGLGLGLSIVRAIADAHGARLRARVLPRGGLDVQVRFPSRPATVPATVTAGGGAALASGAARSTTSHDVTLKPVCG
jgi:signal transduction histidine kinase